MPRLWYPERFHVQIVCYKLAGHLFATYDWPLPPFIFVGGEEQGGGLLDSALALPKQSFAGRYFYKTWDEKAGALLRSLIKNHALVDGNKRIGLATTIVFLMMNGRFLVASNDELVQFALHIAAERSPSWRQISRWIKQRAVPIDKFPRVVAKAKEQHRDEAARLEEIGRAVAAFGKWAKDYRRLENQLRRDCRRLGVDATQVLRVVAEQAVA